jgi:hypothetical protein
VAKVIKVERFHLRPLASRLQQAIVLIAALGLTERVDEQELVRVRRQCSSSAAAPRPTRAQIQSAISVSVSVALGGATLKLGQGSFYEQRCVLQVDHRTAD